MSPIRGLVYAKLGQLDKRELVRFVGMCEVCGEPFSLWRLELRILQLVIDHDHVTGLTRGVVCRGCNRDIGLVEEGRKAPSPQIAAYLDAVA